MKPQTAIAIVLSVVAIAAVWASTVEQFEPAQPTSSRLVTVTNFPNPQNVAGTVNVGNLPATQQVAGTVVAGNLPTDGDGNVRVSLQNDSGAAFRFVGVTTATFPGNGSRLAMHQACNTEYANSRMAFSDEYIETIDPPTVTTSAWIEVRPQLLLDATHLIDPAGNVVVRAEETTWNCWGWNSLSLAAIGGIVTDKGGIGAALCGGASLPAACAAQVD